MPTCIPTTSTAARSSRMSALPTAPISGTAVWNTILVGGLNQGGRGYYALDITNPTAPTLLWEFTRRAGQRYWATVTVIPVITARADGTWVVLVTSVTTMAQTALRKFQWYHLVPNSPAGSGQGYLVRAECRHRCNHQQDRHRGGQHHHPERTGQDCGLERCTLQQPGDLCLRRRPARQCLAFRHQRPRYRRDRHRQRAGFCDP